MPVSDSKFYSGHRERLRQKFLDGKLVEYEKLELLLGYVVPRRDMRPLAHALLKHFGSISQILTASYEELIAFPGVGPSIAIFFKLTHQIMLAGYRSTMDVRPIFYNIDVLKNYCKWSLANKQVEEFHVLYLDSDYRLIKDELHSQGTYNATSVYVREIIKNALQLNSTVLVLVHNHPTSSNSFSSEDADVTEELEKLCAGLDIKLYDHLLVTKYSVFSAYDANLLHKPRNKTKN